MRVNVYCEEIVLGAQDEGGKRVLIERKKAKGPHAFHHFGLQILVGDRNEHTPGDDDTSAVTFWFASSHEKAKLIEILETALDLVKKQDVEI